MSLSIAVMLFDWLISLHDDIMQFLQILGLVLHLDQEVLLLIALHYKINAEIVY